MLVNRFACDSSEWEFAIVKGEREVIALLYFRGERFGPEFRATNQADLQRSIARWLLLHADRAGGLQ